MQVMAQMHALMYCSRYSTQPLLGLTVRTSESAQHTQPRLFKRHQALPGFGNEDAATSRDWQVPDRLLPVGKPARNEVSWQWSLLHLG